MVAVGKCRRPMLDGVRLPRKREIFGVMEGAGDRVPRKEGSRDRNPMKDVSVERNPTLGTSRPLVTEPGAKS